jgi:hypothetical protein
MVGCHFALLIAPKTLSVVPASEPSAVVRSLFCSNIRCEGLVPFVRYLKDMGYNEGSRAGLLDHDIMLLSPGIVQT